jgi:hypothetical protein
VVNSDLLLQHFSNSLPETFKQQALSFEPVFPNNRFFPRQNRTNLSHEKKNFFFYARRQSPETLYYRGLEVVAQAVERGLLKEEDWSFYFLGDNGNLKLPRNVAIKSIGFMTSEEYTDFLGEIDLGLSLMHTPHSGYPTLELAASGAVAVTNQYANKSSLSALCANIICAPPSIDELVNALAHGADLAANKKLRAQNFEQRQLNTNWQATSDKVMSWVLKE